MSKTPAPTFHHAAEGDLAYSPTRWERWLWDARTAKNVATFEPTSALASRLYDARRENYDAPDARRAGYDGAGLDALAFGGETFARLYDAPERAETPVSWASACHAHLDKMPEWEGLRDAVKGDADMASLATLPILAALAERISDVLRDEPETRSEPKNDAGNGEPGDGAPGAGAAGDETGEGTDGEGSGDEPADTAAHRALRSALRRAVDQAARDVADAREALSGLLPGDGIAGSSRGANDGRRLALARALLASPAVRDVLRRAGKLQHVREAKARRDPSARSEVVGVARGGDVARILPSEASLLADPDLEILFFARLTERSLLQHDLRGKTPIGRGPIVVAVDESGSMRGESERWAHAAAVAAILQGRKEKREVAVLAFNGAISAAWIMATDGTVSTAALTEPTITAPFGDAGDLVLELLARRSAGGTSYEPVIDWTLAYLAERAPRADLVLVTDGFCSLAPATIARVEVELARELRIFGVTVGGGSLGAEVAALCEEVVDADDGAEALALAVPRA